MTNRLLSSKRIGLFDSGLGGLSVLKSLARRLQGADIEYIYIGDTLRCPYGNRSAEEIGAFVEQLTGWLTDNHADSIVIACNTSAALVGDAINDLCRVPVFDLLNPTAAHIVESGLNRVGVIATRSTAESGAFSRAVRRLSDSVEVIEIGCPLLVPVVEAGLSESREAVEAMRSYALELIASNVEAIVYGCTHYPFLSGALATVLEKYCPYKVRIIDPAEVLAGQVDLVDRQPSQQISYGTTRFVTTGDAKKFATIAAQCLKVEIDRVESLPLEALTEKTVYPAAARADVPGSAAPFADTGFGA